MRNEYLLVKGQRNSHKTRQAAALREAVEDTCYLCRISPIDMVTRKLSAIETASTSDEPPLHTDVCEPFVL
jgi:hypothetical protein